MLVGIPCLFLKCTAMKRLLLILLLPVAFAIDSNARLEETEQQCQARYGKPGTASTTPGADKTLLYSKDGVSILAQFIKGRCVQISYRKPVQMSQTERDTFFKANGGSIWSNYSGGQPSDFIRADGKAKASYNLDSVTFTLNSWETAHDKAVKDEQAAKQAEEKKEADKFKNDF